MKKLFLLAIVFLGLGISAQAQQAVSSALSSQFTKLYANAEDVEWEEDENNNFIAYFNLGDDYAQAIFTKEGKWITSSIFIDEIKLPAIIIANIKKAYDDFFYNEVEKIETPNTIKYKVEIELDDAVVRMEFDGDGKLLKQEKEKFE